MIYTKKFYAIFLGEDIIYCDSDLECLAIFRNKMSALEKKEEMRNLFPGLNYQMKTIKVERMTRATKENQEKIIGVVRKFIEENFLKLFYDVMMFREGPPSEGLIADRLAKELIKFLESKKYLK